MLTIVVLAIVVLGPEKLPKAISETSAFLRKVRSLSDRAQAEIRNELGLTSQISVSRISTRDH